MKKLKSLNKPDQRVNISISMWQTGTIFKTINIFNETCKIIKFFIGNKCLIKFFIKEKEF